MADYPGGPKPLKPKLNDMPTNTNFSGPAVPVVQPNPFGSSQTKDSCNCKTTPVVPKKK
jgi:hypothetical protein